WPSARPGWSERARRSTSWTSRRRRCCGEVTSLWSSKATTPPWMPCVARATRSSRARSTGAPRDPTPATRRGTSWRSWPSRRARGPHGQPMFGAVELATWWSRAGALLLDVLFIAIPFIVAIPFAATDSNGLHVVAGLLFIAGAVWGYFVYYPVFMQRPGERNG